jgi:hypothetical protein
MRANALSPLTWWAEIEQWFLNISSNATIHGHYQFKNGN